MEIKRKVDIWILAGLIIISSIVVMKGDEGDGGVGGPWWLARNMVKTLDWFYVWLVLPLLRERGRGGEEVIDDSADGRQAGVRRVLIDQPKHRMVLAKWRHSWAAPSECWLLSSDPGIGTTVVPTRTGGGHRRVTLTCVFWRVLDVYGWPRLVCSILKGDLS